MMISPKMYAEEHRNDSFEELIEMRNDLVDELKTLEKIVFDKEQKKMHVTFARFLMFNIR